MDPCRATPAAAGDPDGDAARVFEVEESGRQAGTVGKEWLEEELV